MIEASELDDSTPMVYVTDAQSLAALCERWSQLDAIAVDTEFMRTDTFYAKLGLLQIGDGQCSFLLDPLKIEDWTSFERLCRSDDVEFIFHSCSEDLSVFLSHFGFLPRRIFDTQLAASFLGLGPSLSYAALVLLRLEQVIEKDVTRSDWLQRPLTAAQQRYAAIDVVHLIELRNQLRYELREKNVSDWFDAECLSLIQAAIDYESEDNWSTLYQSLSNAWRLNERGLILLRALCIWREKEARRRDKPKSWIVKDTDLVEVATRLAVQSEFGEGAAGKQAMIAKGALSRVDTSVVKRYASVFVELAVACDYTDALDGAIFSAPLSPELRKRLKKLQAVVASTAEAHGIAPEVLARKRHLLAFIYLVDANPTQSPWPRELSLWKKDLLQAGFEGVLTAH
jgi:ribonuclease D